MALPAQVEQDIKDIEELEKQLSAQPDADIDDETSVAPDKDTENDATQDPPEQTPPPKPDSSEKAQETEDFKQKYNSLRGKYDAEVPRLHTQVKELLTEVNTLKQQLETKQETETPPEPQSYVTDADREEYGEAMIDMQRRVAKEVGAQYETKIANLEKVINDLRSHIETTDGHVSEMTFEQRLTRLVPDFEQVNNDPKWFAWLDEVDPILRGPRRMLAQKAWVEGDAEAVADYVALFKQTQNPPETQRNADEIEKQVAPSRSNTTAVPANSSNKRTYSEAEMNREWNRVTTLNKAGRYDEANKLEAEISAAMLEGRVR